MEEMSRPVWHNLRACSGQPQSFIVMPADTEERIASRNGVPKLAIVYFARSWTVLCITLLTTLAIKRLIYCCVVETVFQFLLVLSALKVRSLIQPFPKVP